MTHQAGSHRLARILTASLAAVAVAAPPALAMPDPGTINDDTEPAPTKAPVVVHATDEGLDWGSAAIGAGGAGALIVLVSLGGFGYAARHHVRVAR